MPRPSENQGVLTELEVVPIRANVVGSTEGAFHCQTNAVAERQAVVPGNAELIRTGIIYMTKARFTQTKSKFLTANIVKNLQ